MNVRFEYLYRDAGNFKRWGDVVFANPCETCLETITTMAHEVFLVDPAYFVASALGVPDLYFEPHIEALDHGWHEAFAFHFTDAPPNDFQERNIETFIEILTQHIAKINVNTLSPRRESPPSIMQASGFGLVKSNKSAVLADFSAASICQSVNERSA
jgi:hypothetical protein